MYMHGSQEIMVDNHPIHEGGARGWGMVIYMYHNISHGYHASTDLYPTVDWLTAPLYINHTDGLGMRL